MTDQMSEAARSHRSAAQGASRSPYRAVLASDATSRCASMASADRQMIGDATLGECLRRWASRHAHRTALVDEDPRISFAQLARRVDRLAAGLHALGLRRGDRAMVQLPNSIGFVTVCLALLRLG